MGTVSDGGCYIRESEDLFEELRFEQRTEQSEETNPANLEEAGSVWRDWQMQRP